MPSQLPADVEAAISQRVREEIESVSRVLAAGEVLVPREIAERTGMSSADVRLTLHGMLKRRLILKVIPRGVVAREFADRYHTIPDPREVAARLLPLLADMEAHTIEELAAYVNLSVEQVDETLGWLCGLDFRNHCHVSALKDGTFKARTTNRCDLHGKQNCCWGVIPRRLIYPAVGFPPFD